MNRPSSKIAIRNDHPTCRLNLAGIREVVSKFTGVMGWQGASVEISLISDRVIANLAGRFRKSPYPTDVLAFDYVYASEIFISLDTARVQARERLVPLRHEIILLCIHGLLHLKGQGDETYEDWCTMRRLEFEAMMQCLDA